MTRLYLIALISLFGSTLGFGQGITGDWTGKLTYAGTSLNVNFKVYQTEKGLASTFSVPLQGLNDFKSTTTSFQDSLLSVDLKPLGIEYKGQLVKNDTVVGNFNQNGLSIKLTLSRTDFSKTRPQEPQPPYTYYEEEVVFRNEKDSISLAGTLTLPNKEGEYPVVILISGSGPQDRNSTILGHKPFLLLAHELTKSGVGVLRYDERGVGQSEGKFQEAELDDFVTDVKSAFDFLKKRKDVDHENIGLLGHSLGGIIAPKLSVEENISFLVLLAAPGIDGDKMMLQQRADLLKLRGLNEAQVQQSNAIFEETYQFIRKTTTEGTQFKNDLTQFLTDNYSGMIMEKQLSMMVEQLTSKEVLGLLRNRPSTYLSMVQCPVLAIGGSNDFQVSSEENLAAIETEIKKGGNDKVEVKEFEGLNHLFQKSETGDSSEYELIEQTMSPKVLDYIKEWVMKTVK